MSVTQSEINDRLRRAVRNGTRLHLEVEHARHLMDPRIYGVLAAIEAEEATAKWQAPDTNPAPDGSARRPANDSSSGASGSGTGPTATIGVSAGSTAESRAADRRVLAAVEQIRQKRLGKR